MHSTSVVGANHGRTIPTLRKKFPPERLESPYEKQSGEGHERKGAEQPIGYGRRLPEKIRHEAYRERLPRGIAQRKKEYHEKRHPWRCEDNTKDAEECEQHPDADAMVREE